MKKQKRNWTKDNKGFSLIELIIAIAIIAILTAMFSGLYLKYVEKARITKQEDSAKKLYDAASAAITEFVIEENDLGLNFSSVTPLYNDPVTGRTCGRITNDMLYTVANGGTLASQPVESQISLHIVENMGNNIDFSNMNPIGTVCNFSDNCVRIIIVFDDNGIFRLGYGQGKYLTTVADGEVDTEKWTSANQAKFSNPN